MDMKELRAEIDALDDTIKDAFIKRMELCAGIAAYKKEHGLPVFHPAREREIVERLTCGMDADMAVYLTALYENLFALSRAYQTKKIENDRP